MDNTNAPSNNIGAGRPSFGANDRREPAGSSIRYVGRKEAKVPLPLVLVLLVVLVTVIVAVRHYFQS